MWKDLKLNFFKRTPVILQTETAECGLTCIAMILNYYRDSSSLFSLRCRYHVSAMGTNLKQLAEIAGDSGLETRVLSLEVDELKLLTTPCILHWEFNHFVTLVQVRKNYCIIHDPAFGRRKIAMTEVNRRFTGVAMELYPAVNFKPANINQRISFKEIFSNLTGMKNYLLKVISLSFLIELINLLIPIGMQLITDHVIKSEDRSLLLVICMGLFFFYLFNSLLSLLRDWMNLKIDNLIGFQWESSLFHHLLKLPLDFFERRQLGDIQSRFQSLHILHKTLTSGIVTGVINSIIIVGLLMMMALYGGWLTWVVIIFSLIYFLLRITTYIIYKQASEEEIIKKAKSSSHFMETLYGITSIKSLGIDEHRHQYWSSLLVEQFNASIKLKKLDILFSVMYYLINCSEHILVLGMGAYSVMQNTMTLGMFIAFNSYRGSFSGKIGELINLLFKLKMLSLHIDRLTDIALTEKEQDSYSLLNYTPDGQAKLRVNELSFQYDKFSRLIFDKVSFEINSGESVALIAPSGFGKTTLLKIMSGLLSPTSGKVFFNDTDIQKMGINYYRKQIACVLQEDKLFSGTILENITAFHHEMDQQKAIHCAALAQIHDEIMAMPMGYETIVGELGANFSGGQKQRIFLARALYKNPKILFLDEATCHLDMENEHKINQEIRNLNITRIIIAHRQSTIASADRVINLAAM